MTLTPAQCPYTGPYALASKGPTCEALKRAGSRAGAPSLPWGDFDQHYNQNLEDALDWIDKEYFNQTGNNGYAKGRWERIRSLVIPCGLPHAGEYALDQTALNLIKSDVTTPTPPAVPDLGPLMVGGHSVLDQDLTHETSGLPLYPAFDDVFTQGKEVIAPEDITVDKKLSSSNPGCAFYATGVSKIQWWFGHLDRNHPLGTKFKKGAVMGKVAPNDIGGGPHCHCAVNVELLWGKGKQLAHHTNYTHGAPTIGEQL